MGKNRKYSLNYKQMLENQMPVTFDNVDIEDGEEVERMWLADGVQPREVLQGDSCQGSLKGVPRGVQKGEPRERVREYPPSRFPFI